MPIWQEIFLFLLRTYLIKEDSDRWRYETVDQRRISTVSKRGFMRGWRSLKGSSHISPLPKRP